ncbi:LytR/AlgR family response regulator transcription factor [Lunatimonas salinarum]|uniref:LytR/AlgR family response regulator transcription factor n=1 Tax=Lunatimonas salinarum TaxID=1774590 RepID=UPI001AE02639|nr:LytTR family DNA-binding domain-containing protein [Lunatimonas salinarum]
MKINETLKVIATNGTNGMHLNTKDLLIKNAIFIRDKGCLTKVAYPDIVYLKGDGNYTTLVTAKKTYSLRNILKEFEEILPEELFIRIHKSYIVNLEQIATISPKELCVANEKVPVGRTYYQALINGIQKLGSGD